MGGDIYECVGSEGYDINRLNRARSHTDGDEK